MTGLEIPGFVIGASGVISCVERSLALWQSLAATKTFGSDMVDITARLSMEYYRFLAWARVSGALQGQSSSPPTASREPPSPVTAKHTKSGTDMAGSLQAPVKEAVAQVLEIVEDISKLVARYAAKDEVAGGQGTAGQKLSGSVLPASSIALGLSPTLPLLGVPHSPTIISAMLGQQNRAVALKRQTPFRMRFTFATKPWGVPNKTALEEKINKLCYWNDRLESVLKDGIRTSLDRQGLAAHLLYDEDVKILDALIDASKHENEGVRTHAKLWKERMDFEKKQFDEKFNPGKYRRDQYTLTELATSPASKCGLSLQWFQECKEQPPVPVAVEWYSHEFLNWDVKDVGIASRRLAELVHLSSTSDRPQSLLFLDSICFVERESALGLIHGLPKGASATSQPVSLHNLMTRAVSGFRRPDLDQRLRLAQQVASSIYSFGLVRWFHKDFNSRNVTFFKDDSSPTKILLDAPFVTGFSIARPDSEGQKSLNKALDALAIYLHPDLRVNEAKSRPAYHRKYEIYSLGLVLLEIGMWKPIDDAVDRSLEAYAFKKGVIKRCSDDLGFYVGPRYRDVVLHCLTCGDDDDSEDIGSSLEALYWSIVLELARLL